MGFLFPACTASFINKNTAITANHLLFPNATLSVVRDGVNMDLTPVERKIPSRTLNQELVLIRCKEEIRGINFPALSTQLPQPGKGFTVLGFGTSGKYSRIAEKLSSSLKVAQDLSVAFGAEIFPMIQVEGQHTRLFFVIGLATLNR